MLLTYIIMSFSKPNSSPSFALRTKNVIHVTIKAFATQYKTFLHMTYCDENKGQLAIKLKKIIESDKIK